MYDAMSNQKGPWSDVVDPTSGVQVPEGPIEIGVPPSNSIHPVEGRDRKSSGPVPEESYYIVDRVPRGMASDLDKAVSSIVNFCSPNAIATYADGRGLLVIVETQITSRARRLEDVREAMGKNGMGLELLVFTPSEVMELRYEPLCPLGKALEDCSVVYGSLDGIV